MHGREEGGENNRKRCRHMWSVPSTTTVEVALNGSSVNYFFKDGRKVSVGDCALFKPPQDSPPFIGFIRCLIPGKGSDLRLSVNWLYRPAEVKLGKGVALEAAPNEVFYSFHRDETPAASLLHPCKVSFLPKGVELPAGISSFVCRRVYDVANKCLWWLTDHDYIDDLQEEIDRLLHKTPIKMHAENQEQQGAPSPKPLIGSTVISPLKHSPDSMQTSGSNFSSHTKGKKRELGHQTSEPIKRERSIRADNGDCGQMRSESVLKLEIAKITENGGLVDSEGVERLVQLMHPDKSERKIDLTGRSMLGAVIAATDKVDCLSQFVELRGLPVLDEWLQEVHKGKFGDSGNFKYSDKSVDDFLLVLLRALDKLPVNLNALQMCNIGKSVNHLRSHRNSEIQKKARSLVDTWKKRVEAEMNVNDAQNVSNIGNRQSTGSSEAAIRSSITHHSSLKSGSMKLDQGALSPTPTNGNLKDGQARISANGGNSEPPQALVSQEKSSSSTQSHTNSPCSSDHAKVMVPSGSRSLNKMTGRGSKHRKTANGLQDAPNRSTSTAKDSVVENVSHIVNDVDAGVHEGNSHKLIVKIPGRGRTTGGCMEDSSCRSSRASSPALSEKRDQSFASLRGKHDYHHKTSNDTRRSQNVLKVEYSPCTNDVKSRKAFDTKFSSMDALIESCVKFSKANDSMSAGDDVGMNLLASVAAGEISKSDIVSPAISPPRNSTAAGNSCSDCNGVSKVDHGETSKHSGTCDDLHPNEEGCFKNNVKFEEQVEAATIPVSPTSNTEKSAGGQSIAVKVESHNELPVASRGSPLAAEDEVKGAPLNEESRKRDHGETLLHPSPIVDDEKDKVSQGLQRNTSLEENSLPVTSQSDSKNTVEKPSSVSSDAGNPNEVKSERSDGLYLCDHADQRGNSKLDLEKDTYPLCQKQEESRVSSTDMGLNTSNVEIKEELGIAPQETQPCLNTKVYELTAIGGEVKESSSSAIENATMSPAGGNSDVDSKLGFDLNEGFNEDDVKNDELVNLGGITLASAAKGPFVPPDDLLRNTRESGWKGSAATSAFRPTEPRKVELSQSPSNALPSNAPACKRARPPLDIDLNVADERILLDNFCQNSDQEPKIINNPIHGFQLDLNEIDEVPDVGRKALPNKPSPSSIFSIGEANGCRDFDLNNGPTTEEMPVEQTSYIQHNIPLQPPYGPRISSSVTGNGFSWYPPGTSYSMSVTPSGLLGRQAFPIVGTGGGPHCVMDVLTSSLSFSPDVYRGSVLSSSPALPFHSSPFQYPVLRFGTSSTLLTPGLSGGPSGYVDPTSGGRVSSIPSQMVGTATAVPFQYPHAYVVSRPIQDVSNNGVIENNHKWRKQGVDLNSGPRGLDVEGRDESLPTVSRQLSAINSQSLAEEQAMLYSMTGGVLKRKEPEGGWNMDNLNFTQSSWHRNT